MYRRIVSLVPSLTETLFDFGAGDRVVAVTDYCVSPSEAARRPRIGGPKTPNVEAILNLAPDLVVAGTEECAKADVEEIARHVPVRAFACCDLPSAILMLREIGQLVDADSIAGACIAEIERVRAHISARHGSRRAPRVFYPVWMNPWITAGDRSFVSAMIRAAGGVNVFADRAEPYPRVRLEEVFARKPDVVFLPDEPFAFGPEHRAIFATSAGEAAVRFVPGRWAAWYGSRMALGLARLHRAVYSTI